MRIKEGKKIRYTTNIINYSSELYSNKLQNKMASEHIISYFYEFFQSPTAQIYIG